jgi:cell filamentation protein
MAYSAIDDPYLDPTTGVLRNKLGITDEHELEKAEASLTAVAIASLGEQPVTGNFDLHHLQSIHRQLFKELYEWAGKLRTVELNKGATRFANSDVLEAAGSTLLDQLHHEKLLVGLDDEMYIKRLAHYYSELNILHPFREGNGRTQRVFFGLLAAQSQRTIAWDKLEAAINLGASIAAYTGDEEKLAEMLKGLMAR